MSDSTRRNLARVVRALLVSLLLLPWLPSLLSGLPLLSALGDACDAWFALHCHRDPARSLPGLAVCVRCYGIYFGLGSGALALRPRLRPVLYRVWLLLAATLVVLDVATEVLHMRPPWAPLRFVSGALLGYPVGVALVLGLRGPSTQDAAAAATGRR